MIIDYSLLLGEIDDPADELRERIKEENDPNTYRGVYFATDGKPYVIGIIDPLTGYK